MFSVIWRHVINKCRKQSWLSDIPHIRATDTFSCHVFCTRKLNITETSVDKDNGVCKHGYYRSICWRIKEITELSEMGLPRFMEATVYGKIWLPFFFVDYKNFLKSKMQVTWKAVLEKDRNFWAGKWLKFDHQQIYCKNMAYVKIMTCDWFRRLLTKSHLFHWSFFLFFSVHEFTSLANSIWR